MGAPLFASLGDRELQTIADVPMMLGISHAIEDTVETHRIAANIYAGFQYVSNFVKQQARYERLARICRQIYIWGIPDVEPPPIPNISYMLITPERYLAREWFLIVDSPQFFSALLSREETYGKPVAQAARRFTGIWSHNGAVVNEAIQILTHTYNLEPDEPFQRDEEAQTHYLGQILQRLTKHRALQAARTLLRHRTAIVKSGIAWSETPLLLLDEEKTIVAVSPSACDLLGVEMQAILGYPLAECGSAVLARRDPTMVTAPRMTLLDITGDHLIAATSTAISDDFGQPSGWVIRLHNSQQTQEAAQHNGLSLPFLPIAQHYRRQAQSHLAALAAMPDQSAKAQRSVTALQQLLDAIVVQYERLALLKSIAMSDGRYHEIIALTPLVQSVVTRIQTTTRANGIHLHLSLPETPIKLRCDAEQIRLAVRELLDNSCSLAAGATQIQVRVSQEEQLVYIQVKDNGSGLREIDQQRVFAWFSETAPTEIAPNERVGIGLALVRTIIKTHHGYVRVQSTEGKGTIVTLILPAAESDD